jgi:dTDP-4-amino-4,6-dideoxygalactose transaminase
MKSRDVPVRIKGNDFTLMNSRLQPALEAAFRDVVMHGGYRQILELEQDVRKRFGSESYAVGVQSGTAALFLCLIALGIKEGHEVIAPPNSDIATTAAISHSGARFVLCDVEEDTFNLDPSRIEACITPRTKAIVPVHLYGHPADMNPILDIARRHGLFVIEDAALAWGATYDGHPVGVIGTAGCFSFTSTKVIGSLGHGGMVVTRDPDLALRIRLFRGYGLPPSVQELPSEERSKQGSLEHVAEGYNLSLDGVQAAVLRVKIRYQKEWAALRQAVADRYSAHFLGTRVLPPKVRSNCVHAWRNYVVRVPQRQRIRAGLWNQGIATSTLYAPSVHLQPLYRHLGLGLGSFPVAERVSQEIVSLPMYPGLDPWQVDEVAEAMLKMLDDAQRENDAP